MKEGKMPISDMNFKERSLLFAKLSKIAYNNKKEATSQKVDFYH